MKNSRLVLGCLALLTLLGIFIPHISQAQSAAETTYSTGDALVTGVVVLAVMILVFLGLMLKARVNELRSFIRKDPPKKPVSPLQELMHLDEAEIDTLMERNRKGFSGNPRAPSS